MASTHHAEWLSLLDISGPFLSPPVLDRVFPQGLGMVDSDQSAKLRLAHQEWAEEQQRSQPDPAIHDQWIRFVLTETLEFTPDILVEGDGVPAAFTFAALEHGESISPSFAILSPESEGGTPQAQLLVAVYRPGQGLDTPLAGSSWIASPAERMVQMCRNGEVRLGLVTNGEQWMLVDAPVGETPGFASWYAELWSQEPLTLRAFQSLLGMRRFFAAAPTDRLEAMLIDSVNFQTEVTDQLGLQVRRAVEVLVHAFDQADQDSGRTLLRGIDEPRLYESALTVMMRLVFLFSAEERGLLLLGDPTYDQHYAVSTMSAQLREAADLVSEEVLESRQDAWSRLLATFRAIFGGVHHESLRIVPYGSSLFDPDRFPFLEGRTLGTTWRETDAAPLPIDNRTVLLLLESLQLLDLGPGKGARKLSFRALDIEQIGHVYETLLDHTARRASEPMVSLQGNQGLEPEIAISTLHGILLHENDELIDFLNKETKKSTTSIRNSLAKPPMPEVVARLRAACGDDELLAKVLPFHDLIRSDPWDRPVLIHTGSVFVTQGGERRATGTHYTPRALTEEIAQYTLEPVVYRGPAESKERGEWILKSPAELLDLKICDPAMGSGAFLVQACRYLSDRLVEAWDKGNHERPAGVQGNQTFIDHAIPEDRDERLALARRLVADRCLYGVDINPLAVEMAKLSMWLITLAKDTPFSFLDHALKCGDSLLGVHNLDQIRWFHLDSGQGQALHETLFGSTQYINAALQEVLRLRNELGSFVVSDIYDSERKQLLHAEAEHANAGLKLLGDLVTAAGFATAARPTGHHDRLLSRLLLSTRVWLESNDLPAKAAAAEEAQGLFELGRPDHAAARSPFHWPLEFPEAFERGGFDALLTNPPFLGGRKISSTLGYDYTAYLKARWNHRRGDSDLAVYFLLRISALGSYAGLILPEVVKAGASRRVGLEYLLKSGAAIFRGRSRLPWPGTSNVVVCIVWIRFKGWTGEIHLDGSPVAAINSRFERTSIEADPARLRANAELISKGTDVLGAGFVVDHKTAETWKSIDPRNGEVLYRYLNGEDFASIPDQVPDRWIINFKDWEEARARTYEEAFAHLERYVKPQRDRITVQVHEPCFWKFWDKRDRLYDNLSTLQRTLVTPALGRC